MKDENSLQDWIDCPSTCRSMISKDLFVSELQENLMLNHWAFSMSQSMPWRCVHNQFDRQSAMKKNNQNKISLKRFDKMSFFENLNSWCEMRGNLTLRSRRYCMISFVEYKLSNFKRQWWRIWIVRKTKIYSLPAKNFSHILNDEEDRFEFPRRKLLE